MINVNNVNAEPIQDGDRITIGNDLTVYRAVGGTTQDGISTFCLLTEEEYAKWPN